MFLNRDLDQQLKSWKAKSKRKPLVLQGARQVGKTSLLKEFGERTYESLIYLNFEKDKKIKKFFEDNLNPQEIIRKLSIYLGRDIIPQATLLFFDEIQESNEALNSLKYFNEDNKKIVKVNLILMTILAFLLPIFALIAIIILILMNHSISIEKNKVV